MKSNLQTFAAVLARNMREARAANPGAYKFPENETEKVAAQIAGTLAAGRSVQGGEGFKATLKALQLKTPKAIREYLRAAPLIEWKCATCKLSREAFSTERLPIVCPACGSERDAVHGPQPLTAADLIAAVKAEEIALTGAQNRYASELAAGVREELARLNLTRAQELHAHLARRLALPFAEVR